MSELDGNFKSCEICGTQAWTLVYKGPIRDGIFGNQYDDAEVAACGGCGIERLAESACKDEAFYETGDYRELVEQGLEAQSYYNAHDHLQIHALNTIYPQSLRDLVIADIGCGAGSFLDHISGLAKIAIAIEPAVHFRKHLLSKGYETYPYSSVAAHNRREGVDFATSFQVIEHVPNPREFLAYIRSLLTADGTLLVSTPNRKDILMELDPDGFRPFFYRVVHRWYFDQFSLAHCAREAGFTVEDIQYVHRYPMANAFHWLRDKRPMGNTAISAITKTADSFWKNYLEECGHADTLFMKLRPAQPLAS
jgi:2-polyprenyl-3-methyl-5-hydroxy-6-metoxy-1,4-benzoquinol methylase